MVGEIDVLLKEKRVFEPPKEIVENSNVKIFMEKHRIKDYNELIDWAKKNKEIFWEEMANELEWFEKWKKVIEWKPPHVKWFLNGKFNITYNCLDRHIKKGNGNKIAYIWIGEDGEERKITYKELMEDVCRLANALKKIGVGKGDRIGIYMPMIPEVVVSMLACARIGAVHTVVFSGFSAEALKYRVKEVKAKVIITCDGFYRRGKIIRLKDNVDKALQGLDVKRCIVVRRIGNDISMKNGRDVWYHEIIENENKRCNIEVMDAEDMLFILYTSGTTGKPKGVIHVHGGYAVGIYTTLKFVFDVKDNDIWWCAADVGWITGHSYIVYAPLMLGITSILYEGAPDYPKPDRIWKIIEKHKVSIFYTAPTTIRMFMKYGEKWPKKHDLSSLRLLGSVGEPINPEAWLWYYKNIGNNKCPIMDTWWQTETGMFLITPLPITKLKPGSATKPFLTIEADVLDDKGNSLINKGGHLVIKGPWPSMFRTLFKEPEKYVKKYWSMFEGIYLTGDAARIDNNGYFWIQGREDDVLNVAGHRIGTSEVESALVSHNAVSEAAVIGKPDPIKGEIVKAFVILKNGYIGDKKLIEELRNHVSKEIGPIAKPSEIVFVEDLPKTRSGKIMRRVIKAIEIGTNIGDLSTLRNPETVEMLKKLRESHET